MWWRRNLQAHRVLMHETLACDLGLRLRKNKSYRRVFHHPRFSPYLPRQHFCSTRWTSLYLDQDKRQTIFVGLHSKSLYKIKWPVSCYSPRSWVFVNGWLKSILIAMLAFYYIRPAFHYITLHLTTFHYISLHLITSHYITSHYITFHFITATAEFSAFPRS